MAHRRSPIVVAALAAAVVVAAPAADASVVTTWNDVTLRAIRDTRPSPPVAARSLLLVSESMYDAWAAYSSRAVGSQLGSDLRRPAVERTDADREEAMSYAAFETIVTLAPGEAPLARRVMARLGYRPGWARNNPSLAALVGHRVAQAVLRRAQIDGSTAAGTGATDAPAVPTPSTVRAVARLSAWGRVTPFGLPRGSAVRPGPPPGADTVALRAAVRRVAEMGAAATPRDHAIAEYWEDPPDSDRTPGHWNRIARWVFARVHPTLAEEARWYLALNGAMYDAAIAAWDADAAYREIRAEDQIHAGLLGPRVVGWAGPGRGIRSLPAAAWRTFQKAGRATLEPAYVSTTSALSAAAAGVIRRAMGSDRYGMRVVIPARSSLIDPGTPAAPVVLSWATLTDAAQQAGWSRLIVGVQMRPSDLAGLRIGGLIAGRDWRHVTELVTGVAPRPRDIPTPPGPPIPDPNANVP